MAEKLPFTFTPNIVRYLREMINRYEIHVQGVPKEYEFVPFSFRISAYLIGESFYSFSETNRRSFVEYVGKNDAINIQDADSGDEQEPYEDKVEYQVLELDDPNIVKGFGHHPYELLIYVNDIRPALALWKIYSSQKGKPITLEDVQVERVVFDDKEGRLIYLNKSYTFHKGKTQKSARLGLFKKLWDERMHIVNKETIKEGKPITVEALTNRLGSRPLKSDFFNLESALRRKGMPIEIEKDGDSVLLIVKESI